MRTRYKDLSMVGLSAALVGALIGTVAMAKNPPSPEWTKDLVIYEIATKAFTSPNGPESGTFDSLREKLPYLQDLGITGIWLTGHSLSDPKHFLNIWSQYAVIEPNRLDPSLGTEDQFRSLVADAHRRGIKIFLDVITHGVMSYSPLVKSHPDWFLGESWGGMSEYDWFGGHSDLDDWWVGIWSDYVTRYGIDGFRLDLGTTRPDLWARIRQNAEKAGHAIVIFEEATTAIPGVTDFGQVNNWISNGNDDNGVIVNDIPRYYRLKFGREGDYDVQLTYAGGEQVAGEVGKQGTLDVRLDGLGPDKVSQRMVYGTFGPDGVPDIQLTVNNIATDREMQHIKVQSHDFSALLSSDPQSWGADIEKSPTSGAPEAVTSSLQGPLALTGHSPSIRVHIPTLTNGNSIMLSCHDNGALGFPLDKNPYSAKGSRAMFGYSFLFTPMIPIFMSGEEFDATFRALPTLSPDFYGGANPGKGRWLYGSMLNWHELNIPQHRSMLEDVKRMLALRKQESSLLTPQLRGDVEPKLVAVRYYSDITVPVPYMRWSEDAAIIVLANRNTDADAHLTLDLPVDKLAQEPNARFIVTDLWNGSAPKEYSSKTLGNLPYTVRRDRSPRGGIGLLRVERVH